MPTLPSLPNYLKVLGTPDTNLSHRIGIHGYDVGSIGRAGRAKANALKQVGQGLAKLGAGIDVAAEKEERAGKKGGGGRGGGRGRDSNEDGLDDDERRILYEQSKTWLHGDDKEVKTRIQGASDEELFGEKFQDTVVGEVDERATGAWGAFFEGKGHTDRFLDNVDSAMRERRRGVLDQIDNERKRRRKAQYSARQTDAFAGVIPDRLAAGEPPLSIYRAHEAEVNKLYADDGLARNQQIAQLNFNMSKAYLSSRHTPEAAIRELQKRPKDRAAQPVWMKDLTEKQRLDLINDQNNRQKSRDTQLEEAFKNADVLLDGKDTVTQGQIESIEAVVKSAPTPQNIIKLEMLRGRAKQRHEARTSSFIVRANGIAQERSELQAQGQLTPDKVKYLEAQEAELASDIAAAKKDSRGLALKTGVIKPVVLRPGHEEFDNDLRERKSNAEFAAKLYGGEPKYFSPLELDGMSKLQADGKGIGIFHDINLAFGQDAPKAYAQIGKAGGEDKHTSSIGVLGYLSANTETGHKVVELYQQGAKHLKENGKKKLNLEYDDESNLSRRQLFRELSGNSLTEEKITAGLHVAETVHEAKILNGDGEATQASFEETVRQVLGEHTRSDGHKYGGVAYTKISDAPAHAPGLATRTGNPTIVPPNIRNDMFDDVIASLEGVDFPGGLPISRGGMGQDVELTIEDIRNSNLKSKGAGAYYLLDENGSYYRYPKGHALYGEPYVLNLTELEGALQRRVPEAYGMIE